MIYGMERIRSYCNFISKVTGTNPVQVKLEWWPDATPRNKGEWIEAWASHRLRKVGFHQNRVARATVWHEMGHINCAPTPSLSESEASAHLWALKETHRMGWMELYGEILSELDHWHGRDDIPQFYAEAREIILKELKRAKMPRGNNV